MEEIEHLRYLLLKELDESSKKMGLIVHPKCWCGKAGKYPTEAKFRNPEITHSCKEHRYGN